MSVFSDTLTRYIEHKNIKVFSLAKYCNLALNEKLTSTFSLFCSTLGTGGGS